MIDRLSNLLALAVESGRWLLVPVLVLCWVFQLLVSPVSAHMVGRAGYRTRHLRRDLLTLDELDDVVARAVVERRTGDDHGDGARERPSSSSSNDSAGDPR